MMTVTKQEKSPLSMNFEERQDTMFCNVWRKTQSSDIGAVTKAGFKRLLLNRYGTIYRAWRMGLDKAGRGSMSFMEFTNAARSVGYSGNIKKLWFELDDDNSGVISLEELDPKINALITGWKTFLEESRWKGNMVKAWKEWFDA